MLSWKEHISEANLENMNESFWKWISEGPRNTDVYHHSFVIAGCNNRNWSSSFRKGWTWYPKIKRLSVLYKTNLSNVVVHYLIKIRNSLYWDLRTFQQSSYLVAEVSKAVETHRLHFQQISSLFSGGILNASLLAPSLVIQYAKTPPDNWWIWSCTCFGGIPLSINSLALDKIWSLVLMYGFSWFLQSEIFFFALSRQSILELLDILAVVWYYYYYYY